MMDFLVQLEQSAFGTWVRESDSLFAYPGILFLHTVGMGIVAGISALIDLRILGFAPEVPLASMERFFPYMWAGFWLNTVSGIALFVAAATATAVNPVFYVKMAFIALAVVVMCSMRKQVFRDLLVDKRPIGMNGKIQAFTSIICWLVAITSGRWLAYIRPGTV